MEVLDVQMAIHVYRQLGDAGMVMGLERIVYVEDKNLLAGHIALLFGNYQTAQVMNHGLSKSATEPILAHFGHHTPSYQKARAQQQFFQAATAFRPPEVTDHCHLPPS